MLKLDVNNLSETKKKNFLYFFARKADVNCAEYNDFSA